MAEKDDKINNPTFAWPDSRKQIELGTITITKAVADSQTVEKELLFMPVALVPGIEAAYPMIAARSASYIVSYRGEPRRNDLRNKNSNPVRSSSPQGHRLMNTPLPL